MPDDTGTQFRLWAPSQHVVELLFKDREPIEMARTADGFWQLRAEDVGAGARYKFRANGTTFPDPASRQQEGDANGWSIVRGPSDRAAQPGPLRPWHETILCEVHVGTVSPEGTFKGLMNRLEHFRDAGYTGLELMPLGEFPGDRGWGYDVR